MINLKKISPVDELLMQDEVVEYIKQYNRDFVVQRLRESIEEVRTSLRSEEQELHQEQIEERIFTVLAQKIATAATGTIKKVINGTGVVLHTNLGRAPLSRNVLEYVQAIAANYSNLELDLDQGKRGSRYDHVEAILVKITGAEAALVVNNNAAAVLLSLNTLADKREVIVSRGQLIEIGGAFRIPEVMKLSGALLKEVGTTNKTYIDDFKAALNPDTALLFTAHTSNYKIVGFAEEGAISSLVQLGAQANIPVLQDLGSGIIFDLSPWGLGEEPMVQECIQAGVDIVTFSGDKLLGGPQAGIIVGKKKYVEAMKKNQLTRALRVDKLTIAALEATLLEYLSGHPQANIPVINMLTREEQVLQDQAHDLQQKIKQAIAEHSLVTEIDLIAIEDMVGGGAYPTYQLAGWGVAIVFSAGVLEQVTTRLRSNEPAILVRKQDDKLLISVRTVLGGEARQIAAGLKQALTDLVPGKI